MWNHPQGGWYYRHVSCEGRDCPQRVKVMRHEKIVVPPVLVRDDPELTLAVRITRVASVDALNGDEEALAWLLEHPLPRMTLEELDINADAALARIAARVAAQAQREKQDSPLPINRPTALPPERLVGTPIGA